MEIPAAATDHPENRYVVPAEIHETFQALPFDSLLAADPAGELPGRQLKSGFNGFRSLPADTDAERESGAEIALARNIGGGDVDGNLRLDHRHAALRKKHAGRCEPPSNTIPPMEMPLRRDRASRNRMFRVDELGPKEPPVGRAKSPTRNPEVALNHDASRGGNRASARAPLRDGRRRDFQMSRQGTLAPGGFARIVNSHLGDNKALPTTAQVALPNFASAGHA